MKNYTSKTVVTQHNTALSMGSGDMEVFATPAMVALMENAAMNLSKEFCEEGATTVGTRISADHTRASGMGAEVEATATLLSNDGRQLAFEIVASDSKGEIGRATHTRFVVNRARFLSKLQ